MTQPEEHSGSFVKVRDDGTRVLSDELDDPGEKILETRAPSEEPLNTATETDPSNPDDAPPPPDVNVQPS